jgi:hypothetical protein
LNFAEVLGAVELFGRAANLRQLSDDDWRQVGAAGFEIATGGYPSIEVLLGKLQRTFDYGRRGNDGAKSIFGQLYQRLEARAAGPAYDQIRNVVGKYIREHLPLGPGDLVFGQPIEKRTLHSIRSLSLETGVYPKLLRKMLRTVGIIGVEHDTFLDANVIFPSDEAIRAVEQAQRSLSLREIGRYLNVPRAYRDGLIQSGLLTPRSSDNRFAILDLDNFLERLFDGAHAIAKPSASQVDIPAAAKRAFCSGATIVRLVIDKKLKWVGRLAGTEGYLAVLIDIEEIREQVRGEDHGGLTPAQVANILKTGGPVVSMLIKQGHIATVRTTNPVNRCPQDVVMPSELERFQKKYVSLYTLAKERGRHFRKLKQEMDEAGIKPTFDVEKVGATFYRRQDCQPR